MHSDSGTELQSATTIFNVILNIMNLFTTIIHKLACALDLIRPDLIYIQVLLFVCIP